MLAGRGPAGTHDLELGEKVLRGLKGINSDSMKGEEVELPMFDKSLHGGKGDRSNEIVRVKGPVGIVILEGWMTGFTPSSPSTLTNTYSAALSSPSAYAKNVGLDYEPPFFLEHSLEDLEFIEHALEGYQEKIWGELDCFVLLRPRDLGYTWEWRLQVRPSFHFRHFVRMRWRLSSFSFGRDGGLIWME